MHCKKNNSVSLLVYRFEAVFAPEDVAAECGEVEESGLTGGAL